MPFDSGQHSGIPFCPVFGGLADRIRGAGEQGVPQQAGMKPCAIRVRFIVASPPRLPRGGTLRGTHPFISSPPPRRTPGRRPTHNVGDAFLVEVVEGAGGERGDGGSFLVRQRFGVGKAGVVVHYRVHKGPSRSPAGALPRPRIFHPRRGGMEARFLTSICSNSPILSRSYRITLSGRVLRGSPVERAASPKTRHPMTAEDAADRPLRHPRKHRQPTRPRPQRPPHPQHLFLHRRADGTYGTLPDSQSLA